MSQNIYQGDNTYGSVSLEDGRQMSDYNEIPEPQPETTNLEE